MAPLPSIILQTIKNGGFTTNLESSILVFLIILLFSTSIAFLHISHEYSNECRTKQKRTMRILACICFALTLFTTLVLVFAENGTSSFDIESFRSPETGEVVYKIDYEEAERDSKYADKIYYNDELNILIETTHSGDVTSPAHIAKDDVNVNDLTGYELVTEDIELTEDEYEELLIDFEIEE